MTENSLDYLEHPLMALSWFCACQNMYFLESEKAKLAEVYIVSKKTKERTIYSWGFHQYWDISMNKSHLYVICLERKCKKVSFLQPWNPRTTVISGAIIYNYPRASVNAYYVHICVDTYICARMYKTINDPGIWESKARILYLYSHRVFLRWQVFILSANINSFIWKKSDIESPTQISL